METYEQIKKFLSEGGKCLLIENSKPIGVVLTIEEYEKFRRSPVEELKTPKEVETENFSADLTDIGIEEDVTLEDLGLDELPN